jgi:hypothetical protein
MRSSVGLNLGICAGEVAAKKVSVLPTQAKSQAGVTPRNMKESTISMRTELS